VMTRIILALAATLSLVGCTDQLNGDPFNEKENLLISNSLKLIGNAADKRGCISSDERIGLFQLNDILTRRRSTHRIVMWSLPSATCNER
jgi:hypothetical protein